MMSHPTTPAPEEHEPTTLDRLVARTEGLQPWRRVFHAASGVVLALVPVLLDMSRPLTLGTLAVIFLVALVLDWARLASIAVNRIFFRIFGRLASPREARGPASSTWYVLGAFLAWALYPTEIAVASILVLGLADPVAGVVGRLYGRRRLGKGSVEGSAAFLLTAVVVLWLILGWPAALVAGVAAAAVEITPVRVDDNLLIPVVTGAVLWLILHPPIAG